MDELRLATGTSDNRMASTGPPPQSHQIQTGSPASTRSTSFGVFATGDYDRVSILRLWAERPTPLWEEMH